MRGSLNDKTMITTETADCTVVYIRKPLLVAVPHLEDKQFNKNPFTKCAQHKHFTLMRCVSFKCLDNFEGRLHIDTVFPLTARRFPRPDFVPVPSHVQPPSEMSEEHLDSITEKELSKNDILEEEAKTDSLWISEEMEYNFSIMKTLQLPTETETHSKQVFLPFAHKGCSSNKTLFLDLDNTLTHTINPSLDYSFVSSLQGRTKTVLYKSEEHGSFSAIRVVVRPQAVRFLEEVSKVYEIVVSCELSVGLHRGAEVPCCRCSQTACSERKVHCS
eukprot:TRINITY_DN4333_c0_g1_i1.p1 TRINITY_DN4333_c0_g1~~TRINITY_DN4333_c0_g1_i1.p1  ORF type:complete len:274 (+),score=28.54 TRINITY_DN4333_c0_g1_i1:117-938(+)